MPVTVNLDISFSIKNAPTITLTPPPPDGEYGQPYDYTGTLSISGGVPPYTPFVIAADPAPVMDGLTATISGNQLKISGTPTGPAQVSLRVSAGDSFGK